MRQVVEGVYGVFSTLDCHILQQSLYYNEQLESCQTLKFEQCKGALNRYTAQVPHLQNNFPQNTQCSNRTEIKSTHIHIYTQPTHKQIHTHAHAYTDKSKQILVTLTHYQLTNTKLLPTHPGSPPTNTLFLCLHRHNSHCTITGKITEVVSPLTESVRLKLVPF